MDEPVVTERISFSDNDTPSRSHVHRTATRELGGRPMRFALQKQVRELNKSGKIDTNFCFQDRKPLDYNTLKEELGDGPARFAPIGERSIEEQLKDLTEDEKKCFDGLKSRWEAENRGYAFNDEMYLRFASCSPGRAKFNEKMAWMVMKNFDSRYLNLSATAMERQLLTKTLFVVPGLKSNEGHEVFYMRPSRYSPKKIPTHVIIDNLAYCMQAMTEKENCCNDGIAFLANMDDWKLENFGVTYCRKFMMMLQGRVPARVQLFLIVNPPSWFDVIWSIMKPMLARDFRRKVFMIPDTELNNFLMDGYTEFLPDDMQIGKVSTEDMVKDFIAYRKYVEHDKFRKPGSGRLQNNEN